MPLHTLMYPTTNCCSCAAALALLPWRFCSGQCYRLHAPEERMRSTTCAPRFLHSRAVGMHPPANPAASSQPLRGWELGFELPNYVTCHVQLPPRPRAALRSGV